MQLSGWNEPKIKIEHIPISSAIREVQAVAEEIPGVRRAEVCRRSDRYECRCIVGERRGSTLATGRTLAELTEALR